jgi:ABC-type multidrug transport system fused ATPase/permease subunit
MGIPLSFEREICFRDVEFSYDDGQSIIKSLNLTIPCGQSLGIMGPSGGGKSTFVDLLTGLLQPGQGTILVDDSELTFDNADQWQRSIGYVPQFPYIFDGTLAENVAFGLPRSEINREQILNVCQMAAIDFIDQLPEGIDSMIGERGVRLSGGQRQRIAIARALYRNPELIIFDEATSALDEEKDAEIRQLLFRLKGKRTLIVVSHRPSTIADCDVVVTLS